ncbi:MAG TPA: outer-membrane lipoprotein carrier protein LolA [Hyphomicrobium sp.]|nr:outer-membrane lipoprotein carrier protein LolA [Hyphomicrobium sp.]
MGRNMKKFNLIAAASLALALVSTPALAQDGPENAVAPPAPVPAARPGTAPEAPPAAEAGAGWDTEVATPGSSAGGLSDSQTAAIKQVDSYFNTLGDLKGAFVQTTADNKRMRGKFMMKRPGRFRFDYARPSRQIIISDGKYLAIQDLDLNNEDRVSLDQTPFRLLLRKDVDLIRDANIVEIREDAAAIELALRDKSPDAPGQIRLTLTREPELAIKEWITTDAQGLDTHVQVSELVTDETLDAKLFRIETVTFSGFHPGQ